MQSLSALIYGSITIVSPAKEVMFSSALICLSVSSQDYAKTTQPVFSKFNEKLAYGPRKKRLDFDGNPYHEG